MEAKPFVNQTSGLQVFELTHLEKVLGKIVRNQNAALELDGFVMSAELLSVSVQRGRVNGSASKVVWRLHFMM